MRISRLVVVVLLVGNGYRAVAAAAAAPAADEADANLNCQSAQLDLNERRRYLGVSFFSFLARAGRPPIESQRPRRRGLR